MLTLEQKKASPGEEACCLTFKAQSSAKLCLCANIMQLLVQIRTFTCNQIHYTFANIRGMIGNPLNVTAN